MAQALNQDTLCPENIFALFTPDLQKIGSFYSNQAIPALKPTLYHQAVLPCCKGPFAIAMRAKLPTAMNDTQKKERQIVQTRTPGFVLSGTG